MSVTIHLPPDLEKLLRERAEERGQDEEALATQVLANVLRWDERERRETIEGVQRGLRAAAEGRCRPLEEFVAEQVRKYNLPDEE
jgi:predicted transcriptional regulator